MRRTVDVILVVLIGAGHAHAQSSGASASAEQLFNEARELAKANRWAEACPKFEASLHYDPVAGTRLNLATCYEHVGKLASAWALYRESIEAANKNADVAKREYAERHAAALEPRLPRLAISARTDLAGLVVTRDGTKIDTGTLGTALYVDPGTHKITASAPGFEPFSQTVTLIEGKTETLLIPELRPLPHAAAPPNQDRSATTDPRVTPSKTRRYVAVAGGAAGVAALGVGFFFGGKALSAFSDAKEVCGTDLGCSPGDDYESGKKLISDARSYATTSTVFVIAGSATLVASAVLFLVAPRSREGTAARIVPVAHDRGAGLALMGRF